MIIEILSPSNAYYDLIQKKDLYEKYGVKEYIIFDPIAKNASLFALKDGIYYLHQKALENLVKQNPNEFLISKTSRKDYTCEACIKGKLATKPFPKSSSTVVAPVRAMSSRFSICTGRAVSPLICLIDVPVTTISARSGLVPFLDAEEDASVTFAV